MLLEESFSKRLAQLRLQKGVSARDMSLSVGQSASYINNIENGRNLPSMMAFFYICEYLGITPKEFFEDEIENPSLVSKIVGDIKGLNDEQLTLLSGIISQMKKVD